MERESPTGKYLKKNSEKSAKSVPIPEEKYMEGELRETVSLPIR